MNKIYIIILAALVFTGCRKNTEPDLVFDKPPQERMTERNAELRNKLVENTFGWKAVLGTSLLKSGFSFYMKFDENEKVMMLADLAESTAEDFFTSTYRIKYITNTTLIFDTYNYLTLLQDPNPNAFGGVSGEGLKSDIEFDYLRSTEDSIILKGRKYQNILYLVKASQAEMTAYDNGEYVKGAEKFADFLSKRKSNYFTVNGKTVDLFFNPGIKTVSGLSKYSADSVASVLAGFAYGLDGVPFTYNFVFDGISFAGIKIKDATNAVVLDRTGKEYPLVAASKPVIDFKETFAYNNVYKGIIVRGETLPEGVSSKFNSVFNGMVSRFRSSGRSIQTLEFRFTGPTSMAVQIFYLSGSRTYLADASFDYKYENGIITLSNYTPSVSNSNWNSRDSQIGNFADWIQDGPFRVDWAESSSPNVGTLAALYKVSDDGDFFYGSPNN